ncbi:hypothetical protein JKP88DRAFT_280933 [Tribonema minus]|uniref:TAZ-type domain-containing protein n=1 Tax=Tribonema minus TaxID=303371 RepID=A0A835YP38_9STRA|nr:hypothetical protein JKP88DRAFT_280933 [Tribonema minus]
MQAGALTGQGDGQGAAQAGGKPQYTQDQRALQQQQQRLLLLRHASACVAPKGSCPKARADAANRERLERQRKITMHMQLLAHAIHARQCDKQGCKVPGCDAMRQQMRAALKQQEEKDARRRQLMKSWYRERAQRARSAPKSGSAS